MLMVEPRSSASPTIRQLLPVDAESRDLTAVLTLADGDVLLGTRHRGVLLYNGETLVPFRFSLAGVNPASLQITALAAVDAASFLIGTRNSGVFYVHAGTVNQANADTGLPDDQVEAIAISRGPGLVHVFVGTPVGTTEFDLAEPSFRPVRLLARGTFSHSLVVEERHLTIGTLDQGIQEVPLEGGPSLRRVSISAGPINPSLQRVDAFLTARMRSLRCGWNSAAARGRNLDTRACPRTANPHRRQHLCAGLRTRRHPLRRLLRSRH